MKYYKLIMIGLLLLSMVGCGSAQPNSTEQSVPTGLEVPALREGDDVVVHIGYTAAYNHRTLVSDWVAYELTAEELQGNCSVNRNYSRDPQVAFPKASREDYSRCGWDKGHMAARADMKWSEQALVESDYFTNIFPQNSSLNAGIWNRLEGLVRGVARKYGAVYVVTGPIYSADNDFGTIGSAGVCIPSQVFKALLVKDGEAYKGVAFVMPNAECDGHLSDYAISIDQLEAMVGLDLYPLLPDEAVEASFNWDDWKVRKQR